MADDCTISFRINRRAPLILVDGTINDTVPIHFVVDTGASITVISPEVAKRAGVRLRGGKAKAVGADGSQNTRMATLGSLDIGKMRVKNLGAAVMDLENLNHAAQMNVGGILGFNFLRRYQCTINYVCKTIRFTTVNRRKPAGSRRLRPTRD